MKEITPPNPSDFSRRSFLKTSILASGGILIGFNFFSACKALKKFNSIWLELNMDVVLDNVEPVQFM